MEAVGGPNMTVHLVVRSIWDDWVISRLAKYLVDGLGWSYGKRPKREAEVNIFFPYLEWRHSLWAQTLTVSWFTHKRKDPWGQKVWEQAAGAADLCVSFAKMYTDDLSGKTSAVNIPAPVDLDHFTPNGAGAFRSRELTVGVSGIINKNDMRKGEALVSRLKEDGYKVVAAGRGWPCPTHWYSWEEMPMFYHSLDCFLVTSEVEGGPVTVLEALACGKPAVVPLHVGQCDEYERVGHYDRTNYADLLDMIRWQSHSPYGPEDLRAEAEKYPVSRWCSEWKTAIEQLLDG